MMRLVILAVINQLKNFPTLSYAKESAYVAEDPWDLMEKDTFPFFNVYPGDERILRGVDGTSKHEFERHIFPIIIQFATASLNLNVAIMGDDATNAVGILDFSDHIWQAIIFDPTLSNVVDGIEPGNAEIPKDFLKGEEDKFFAQGEIKIEFYKDVAIA